MTRSLTLKRRGCCLLVGLVLSVGVCTAQSRVPDSVLPSESSRSNSPAVFMLTSESRLKGDPSLGLFAQPNTANPPPGWVAQFHPKVPNHTQLRVEQMNGTPVLRIESDAGYGSWAYRFSEPTSVQSLTWKWVVQQLPQGANLRTKEGDDAALKLCLFIEIDESKLNLRTRLKLATARSLSGESLPAATLCYAWSEAPVAGGVFPSPYTERVRMWVLRSDVASKTWRRESRNVIEDATRVFGDELPQNSDGPIVKILGIAIGGDADNTQSNSLGFVKQLKFH